MRAPILRNVHAHTHYTTHHVSRVPYRLYTSFIRTTLGRAQTGFSEP